MDDLSLILSSYIVSVQNVREDKLFFDACVVYVTEFTFLNFHTNGKNQRTV